MDKRAFSRDGYIINQNYTFEYPYGVFYSNKNGCGWIAIYNLLKLMGNEVDYKFIHESMNEILPYYGITGTPTKTMKDILNKYNIKFREVRHKRYILEESKTFKYAIFRYIEQGIPHYVTVVKVDDNKFRFFNAQLGNEEHVCSMEEFYKRHVKVPIIKALIVD